MNSTNYETFLKKQSLKNLSKIAGGVEKSLLRKDFHYFIKYFWDVIVAEDFVDNWHIKFLADKLQAIGYCLKNREQYTHDTVIINIPPGTSKSTIVTIMFPAWLWTIDPTLRIIAGSYSGDLATDHAIKSRDVIQSGKFKALFTDVDMKPDQNNKTAYVNKFNGSRTSTSVGGTITGQHAHVIIVDDPINPQQAMSEAERKTANNWISGTLSTRKVNKKKTVTIIVMQRLHEEDPTGTLLKKKKDKIEHICLPAELSKDVSPSSVIQYYKNGLLDPNRMDKEVLKNAQIDLGSYSYAGQYMQRPSPAEGEIIQKHWFKYFTLDSLVKTIRAKRGENVDYKKFIVKRFYSDTAYGKEGSDNTATITYSVFNGDIYIWDVWAEKLGLPQFKKRFVNYLQLQGYDSRSIARFEPKASGISTVQELKELDVMVNGKYEPLNVVEDEPPKDSKITRTVSASPKIEAGHVYLLEGAHWVEDFLDECTAFPNGTNDDRVDCLSAIIRIHLQNKKRDDGDILSWA